jgi:hypothetical protein
MVKAEDTLKDSAYTQEQNKNKIDTEKMDKTSDGNKNITTTKISED